MPAIKRTKAGLIHFFLSLSIFTIILFVLIELWYPTPYFNASGGWQGLKIVTPIDIILGPLLTLLVFNPAKSKRELRTDLSIILVIQLSALLWGIHTIYQQRPIAAIFWESSFLTISAIDLTSQNYPIENLKEFGSKQPILLYADRPKTKEGLNRMLSNLKKDGIAPHHQTEWFRALMPNFSKILPFQLDIENSRKKHLELAKQLDEFLLKHQYQQSQLHYFILQAKYKDMMIIFDQNGDNVGYLVP